MPLKRKKTPEPVIFVNEAVSKLQFWNRINYRGPLEPLWGPRGAGVRERTFKKFLDKHAKGYIVRVLCRGKRGAVSVNRKKQGTKCASSEFTPKNSWTMVDSEVSWG
jgi:hypothetical protein